jgi:predicted nucleic acid-binding protein
MICLDANVWIYYLDATLAEHRRIVRPVRETRDSESAFHNAVVALEVVHYLRKQHADPDRAVRAFLNLGSTVVSAVDHAVVERADELLGEHPHVGIGGRDASLVAAMERNDVTELWTHNEGLKRLGGRLDWLSVVDPAE